MRKHAPSCPNSIALDCLCRRSAAADLDRAVHVAVT
jgi:hypothetical protein